MRAGTSGVFKRAFGIGGSRRLRVLRGAAAVCFVAAIALLATSLTIALNQPPTQRPLPVGTVFSVARATPQAATPTPTLTPTASPTPAPSDTPTPAPTASPTPEPTPSPSPTPPPSEAPLARLVIPSIKVNAPVSFKSVDVNGVMQDPNSWNDVAYYTFTGRPGFGTGNNAVFAGHVDYIHHGAAVFWDLNKLTPGDEVRVGLQDGTSYVYRVTQMTVYASDDAPIDEILGETPSESVTLITCNGVFSAGHYNNRLVVRAERVDETSAPTASQSGG